jgi:predicted HNH restriction endonuclease
MCESEPSPIKAGSLFSEKFRPFLSAVPARESSGNTFDQIPSKRASNYWRDGVRHISNAVYDAILSRAELSTLPEILGDGAREWPTLQLQSGSEGSGRTIFTTIYERDPALRRRALAILATHVLAAAAISNNDMGHTAADSSTCTI